MVHRHLPEGGTGGLRLREGLHDPAALRLRHLGEHPAHHGRDVQKDRTRQRGDAGADPGEPAEEGGRAGGGLCPGGGVGHHGRQREAGGAAGLPAHLRDHVLRPLAQCTPELPGAAHALQPVVLRHPLGKDHPALPAQSGILVAGGPHHP